MSVKYYDCVRILALVNRHAMCMRRILLSSVACLSLPYFSSLSHRRNDFLNIYIYIYEHEMYVLIFSTNLSVIFSF
jgi:hypothetical protein